MNAATPVIQLSSSQCRRARALLKWNLSDLASRVHVSMRTLQKFEHNVGRLIKSENDALFVLFSRHGIDFASDGVVTLHGSANDQDFFFTGKEHKAYNLELDPLTPVQTENDEVDLKNSPAAANRTSPKSTTKP
ncbi:MAG: hypothetical protein ACK5R4_05150 [Alphaproteobacteria bacterium]